MMTPKTEAELADAVRDASGPLRIIGGGTRPIGRPVTGEALTTAAISGISLHEPGALTLVAASGTPVEEIEATLAKENQRLPFEPMDHRALLGTDGAPTIGGVAAANVSGPRRIAVGAARDFMLGVRFVDGTGEVIKNGGRVMKNVTGYDLVKLLAGSYGTLGVLSEVSLKVLPRVDAMATLTLTGLDAGTAVKALSAGLGSPFEVTGAAHTPDGKTLIRIEGFADSVSYRAGQLAALLAPFGSVETMRDRDEIDALWRDIRDVRAFAGQPGDVWRLSVKPSDAPGIVARAGATQTLLDWGGGLIWMFVPEGTDLRAKLGDFNGHATLVRASESTRAAVPAFQPEAPAVAALTNGLRTRFDPRGILNPGLMA